MAMVYASVDPERCRGGGRDPDPPRNALDRRNWAQDNSHRADVMFDPRPSVRAMISCCNCCLRTSASSSGGTRTPTARLTAETDVWTALCVHYMLAYWLYSLHGVIAPPAGSAALAPVSVRPAEPHQGLSRVLGANSRVFQHGKGRMAGLKSRTFGSMPCSTSTSMTRGLLCRTA